jgi:hypothetical protein
MRRLFKKGFFISLAALIILGLLVFFLRIGSEQSVAESRQSAQFLKNKLSSQEAGDTEDIYIPAILQISAKYAMSNVSNYVYGIGSKLSASDMKDKLTSLMTNGTIDGSQQLMPQMYAVPFLLNSTLSYVSDDLRVDGLSFSVINVSQPNPWEIEIITEVSFNLTSGDLSKGGIRWGNSINYTNLVNVNSMADLVKETGAPIQVKLWNESNTYLCYLSFIVEFYNCNSVKGIEPLVCSTCGPSAS